MQRVLPVLAASLLLCGALAGCSSSTPAKSDATTGSASSAPASASAAPTASASADSGASGSGSGTITFTGAFSGTMTVDACHGSIVQLAVLFNGGTSTYAGIIDADDFTFVTPKSTGFTLAKGAAKPQVSGKTFTVTNTKLVGITNDDTVTANGSVTCP